MVVTGVDRPDVSTRVAVRFGVPQPQRRVTVLFRLILVIPHLIVLEFVAIAALVVLVLAWFAALFTGRMPEGPGRFLCGYLRWVTRVDAYLYLLTDQYPPFQLDPSPDYPVDFVVQTGRLNRWAVLFRYFLAIPAAIAVGMVTVGLSIFSVVLWVATLIRGTMPQWMFEAVSAVLRYRARFSAYYFLQGLPGFRTRVVRWPGGGQS
jgi:hypothetical protein